MNNYDHYSLPKMAFRPKAKDIIFERPMKRKDKHLATIKYIKFTS